MLNHEETLVELSKFDNEQLSIIKLTEPFVAPTNAPGDQAKRTSDVSSDASENPSPASMAADLEHFRGLFSKLRFSYLEQVTKEKFLRAIVGDRPQIVEHQENVQFEAQLIKVKADLKAQKDEVAALVAELDAKGQELSRRYTTIQTQLISLRALPAEITSLQTTISSLRTALSPTNNPTANPILSLSLSQTQPLLASKSSELSSLDARLDALEAQNARKRKELQRVEGELKPLEQQRAVVAGAAREARKRKEESEKGAGDEVEMRGRWFRGVEDGLRRVLEVPVSGGD
ncbi:MAG: hypothetical protein MMC33_009073 [Icmadophila ericetorum]|nr:hypothetical protein [Icmadophila ericetorum]